MKDRFGGHGVPLVSVIIPAYNRERFVGEAIESVLSQSVNDCEILVIDDGSTDRTKDVVMAYGDRVRYLYQQNKGSASARNAGLVLARGRFVAFLDSDDVWLPGKLEYQLDVMESRPEVKLVHGAVVIVHENACGTERLIRSRPEGPSLEELILDRPVCCSTVLVRRECFERGAMFDESLIRYQDSEMWFRLRLQGDQFYYIDRVLARYRVHESNVTRDIEGIKRSLIAIYQKMRKDPSVPAEFKSRLFERRFMSAAYYDLSRWSLRKGEVLRAIWFLMISMKESPSGCLWRGHQTIGRRIRGIRATGTA